MVETIFRGILITFVIVTVLGVLGTIAINYNLSLAGYTGILQGFLAIVFYVLPFNKLMPIFVIVIAFSVYKIAISVLKTLWSILPMP